MQASVQISSFVLPRARRSASRRGRAQPLLMIPLPLLNLKTTGSRIPSLDQSSAHSEWLSLKHFPRQAAVGHSWFWRVRSALPPVSRLPHLRPGLDRRPAGGRFRRRRRHRHGAAVRARRRRRRRPVRDRPAARAKPVAARGAQQHDAGAVHVRRHGAARFVQRPLSRNVRLAARARPRRHAVARAARMPHRRRHVFRRCGSLRRRLPAPGRRGAHRNQDQPHQRPRHHAGQPADAGRRLGGHP